MRYGVDVGRSSVKAVANHTRVFLAPVVGRVHAGQGGLLDDRRCELRTNGFIRVQSLPVSYNGEGFLLGDEQERLGRSCVWPMEVVKAAPMTRLLMLGAMGAIGLGPTAEVCLGLPIALYQSERSAMLELLRGEHTFGVDGVEHALTLRAMVVPEGFGLLVRACRRDDGTVDLDKLRESTLVVDFGHRTTQMCLFRRGRMSDVRLSMKRGIGDIFDRALCDLVDTRLRNAFDPVAHSVMSQDLVATGELSINGLHVDYTEALPVLRHHVAQIWPEIRSEMRRTVTGVKYHRVVVGGGGVHLLEDEVRDVYGGMTEVLGDRYAQAEGYADCIGVRKELLEL